MTDLFLTTTFEKLLQDTDLFFGNGFDQSSKFFPIKDVHYPVDIYIKKSTGDLIIETSVVGKSKKDINIKITDGNVLNIEYVKPSGLDEDKDFENGVRGIKNSSFKHRWKILPKFDINKIEPKLENGLLTIKIPLSEGQKDKEIEIK